MRIIAGRWKGRALVAPPGFLDLVGVCLVDRRHPHGELVAEEHLVVVEGGAE